MGMEYDTKVVLECKKGTSDVQVAVEGGYTDVFILLSSALINHIDDYDISEMPLNELFRLAVEARDDFTDF